jgi:2-polyprenyl-6-methoxyphenol hydroxylase-like FAD-dependent oxidoreductase
MRDPVLVVGAGPTGMTAALELSRFGVPVRIIDKGPAPPEGVVVPPEAVPPDRTRAIGVHARTLELLEMRGLSEELIRSGNPAAGASVYGDGRRLFRVDFSHLDSRYNYLLFVSQTETERVLREAIEKHGVAMERGVELIGFAQDELAQTPSPVSFVLRHADGRLEEARAPWLIDAEGAYSVVRTTLMLPFEGRTFEQTYALGDVHVEGDLSEGDFHLFSSEHGFLGLFPLGHGRFRVIAGESPTAAAGRSVPSIEELQAIYDQRSPVPARLSDIRWASWFHINSRMVKHLRVGRLLLGGDAAHIHSPAGGQGLNTGIQDMINLAWKLALVMRGQASPALLDTFEAERLPVARNVLGKTAAVTDLVGSANPVVNALFDHFGPWIVGVHRVQEQLPFRISQLAVSYRASPLSAHHGRLGRLHAGDRLPDLPVRSRTAHGEGYTDRSLFEIVDPLHFTLLVVRQEADGAAPGDWCEAVRPWEPLIRVVGMAPASDEADRERFRAVFGHASGVILVRPDGYVGFAGGKHATGRHLGAYCRRWLTASHAPVSRAAA